MPEDILLGGNCDECFKPVEEAFLQNFRERNEVGASLAVIHEGRLVLDLWGGHAVSSRTREWNQDTIVNKVVKSQIIGFFVQDSWSIMDKVTLNLGLRYDTLQLKNDVGITGLALNDQLSPRIGFVWDPTQQGRSKLFANYGRYYEYVPLDLANRALSAETQIRANHVCNPNNGRLACDANSVPGQGATPSTIWGNTGTPYPSAVDPNVKSPSNDEIVAGAEYEIIPNARLGVTYTYRNLVQWIEDMSNTDGATYFIGNPGSGIASTFPKAQRTYNAVTVQFTKNFADLWLAQASYTWAKLEGNLDGIAQFLVA